MLKSRSDRLLDGFMEVVGDRNSRFATATFAVALFRRFEIRSTRLRKIRPPIWIPITSTTVNADDSVRAVTRVLTAESERGPGGNPGLQAAVGAAEIKRRTTEWMVNWIAEAS